MSEEERIELREALNGVHSIINGLEYHFKKYSELSTQLSKIEGSSGFDPNNMRSDSKIIDQMKHEAIAYLNRMGQIYFFARSQGVNELLGPPEKTIPAI